jgi:hypothetical protein
MTDIQKFHDMCVYQFEMGYDLAISPECDVSHLNCTIQMYFGTPGIRPDASRRVSNARLLSQTLADTEMTDCHISALKQDCWS